MQCNVSSHTSESLVTNLDMTQDMLLDLSKDPNPISASGPLFGGDISHCIVREKSPVCDYLLTTTPVIITALVDRIQEYLHGLADFDTNATLPLTN